MYESLFSHLFKWCQSKKSHEEYEIIKTGKKKLHQEFDLKFLIHKLRSHHFEVQTIKQHLDPDH